MTNYKLIKELLNKRKTELEHIATNKKLELRNAPAGELRAAVCKKQIQYFKRESHSDTNGVYIKVSDRITAVRLAQKEYDMKILQAAEKEIRFIRSLDRLYGGNSVEGVTSKMVKAKVDLINPVAKSDEEYVKEWLSQDYTHNNQYLDNLIYANSRGIRMRSKSEVIISSILDELGIPYLYEKTLSLGKNKCVSPDFTLLDMRDRKEVYLEHFGMMDNLEYVSRSLEKLNEYATSGIYLGGQLLITYESSGSPINIDQTRNMIASYFKS